MAAYQRRQHTLFSTVHTEGANLPMDMLQRVAQNDPPLEGLSPDAYHLSAEKLNEAINRSWNKVVSSWLTFKTAQSRLPATDSGTTITRERWLHHLFNELGYGRLLATKPMEVNGKSYAISHSWQHTPIHLVSYKIDLDHMTRSAAGTVRSSPHSLLQELLNRSDDHLWGIVSNGLKLRILRDNVSITRQAYIEFDLQAMMDGEVYADFVLLWLLCHESRVEAERPEECWLEKWSRMAQEQGTRALEQLRSSVKQAIEDLGSGFLAHSDNGILREKLRSGKLEAQDYYRQILRLVYRLIVLFVAEDRAILFDPQSAQAAQEIYTRFYSTTHLRYMAEQHIGTRHADLFQGLRLVMEKLGTKGGCPELGLPALNGFLFSSSAIEDLEGCEIANHALLAAIRSLAYTTSNNTRRVVDYKNLGSEELGSVYESLLELHPVLRIENAQFKLATASGNDRKTTGSYYTPTSLINSLLDSALEPVLSEALAQRDPEKAILNLKVCDPACGSGHFLVAAAHRIAKRLAAVRTGEEEPAPEQRRSALRDVIGHCIYGVDINPMSVELCKVSLWMESIEPGKPLSFLDAHIQCGNSLLGATPALLNGGIPDSAFEPIEGDDKKICSEYKKMNRQMRAGQRSLWDADLQPWDRLGDLVAGMMQLEEMSEDTVDEVHRKQQHYDQLIRSSAYEFGKLWADAWCAAFAWKKTKDFVPLITEESFRNLEKSPYRLAGWVKDEIKRLAQQYQFFHWHLAFPDVFRVPTQGEAPENMQTGWSGGFDVVLGNPPWERIKIQEKEWFAARRPDIANASNAAQRKKMIKNLQTEDPELYTAFMEDQRKATGESHIVRDSGHYPLCGRGDVNTYTIFAENMYRLIGPSGRAGCIVPSGIATDDTTKYFFQDISRTRSLVSLTGFINEEQLFPAVLHNFKFCLLVLAGFAAPSEHPDFVFNCYNIEQAKESERHFSLDVSEINLLNPNTGTCPVFFWKRSAEITKEIYRRIPILDREGTTNSWGISFLRMFDMANDSHLFQTEPFEGSVALYEAKMLHQYNHRYASYEHLKAGERSHMLPPVEDDRLADPNYTVAPCYYVPKQEVDTRLNNYTSHQWLLGYREITIAGATRTTIYSVLPRVGTNHKIPLILLQGDANLLTPAFLACMNSFVFDFCARQKLGGSSFNFFIKRQLPVISPVQLRELCAWDRSHHYSSWIESRVIELVYTAWDVQPFAVDFGYNCPPFKWDKERRFLLRCELDAAYFHLYGIAREDINYIMDTFRLVKERDEKQYGEYRTKRVILEIYDEMRRAMETGIEYATRLVPGPADLAVAHEGKIGIDA
ncbi:Eco57I restriction-modification methylase domain-containing protein [Dictyobacter formicarum]|uniref:site-specific DNA-methyltransferase (adenine-specific) n=1 Tax=Dictyobacter formicarum TaxID=2778368 RepID=A0ABQ3VR30_9CHLR|nr:N-6 DNA methylase [Dictyobacter formicarum]GHO88176.1 hypothetical protein KSZ_61820 [Dictyobacter formicarum]